MLPRTPGNATERAALPTKNGTPSGVRTIRHLRASWQGSHNHQTGRRHASEFVRMQLQQHSLDVIHSDPAAFLVVNSAMYNQCRSSLLIRLSDQDLIQV